MRKYLKAILFLAAAVTLMSVTALAADAGGIYDIQAEANVTVIPQTEDGTPVTVTTENINGTNYDYYAGAVKVEVQYTGTTEKTAYYLILAQNAEGTPTDKNIVYIDQATGSATFTVYPSSLTTGTYYIYLSSTGSAKTQIASFKYYLPYKLGDVNADTNIRVDDALLVLNYLAQNTVLTSNQMAAADVTGDNNVRVDDALKILNFIAGNISSLE